MGLKKDIVKILNEHSTQLTEANKKVDELIKEYSRKTNPEEETEISEEFKKGYDTCRLIFLQDLQKLKTILPKE